MAVVKDVTLFHDVDYTVRVTMKPATVVTGWTVVLRVFDSEGDLVVERPAVLVDANIGKWDFALSPDTHGLSFGESHSYQIRRTDVGGRDVLTEGVLTLKRPRRTRPA